MQALFIPELAAVADTARSVAFGDVGGIIELKKNLEKAREFIRNFEDVCNTMLPSLSLKHQTEEIVSIVKKDIENVKMTLKDLENVLEHERFIEMNPVIYSLEKHASNLTQSISQLTEVFSDNSPESPIPVINHIINVGYNVAKGGISHLELAVYMPVLAAFAAYAKTETDRFSLLHPAEVKILDSSRKLVEDLQDAAGAMYIYLKDQEPSALVDSLRILKYASAALYINLRMMDAASQESRFSDISSVEEFARAYELYKKDSSDANILSLALINLKKLAAFYLSAIDSVRNFHYFPFIKDVYNLESDIYKEFTAYNESILNRFIPGADIDLKKLKTIFEKMSQEVSLIVLAVENEMTKVAGAPYIEEIKELIARYLSGSLVLEYFSHRLDLFAQNHRSLLEDFKNRSAGSELAAEVCQLLDMQKVGIDEMMLFFNDSDKTHLISGMKQVEEALPRLLEIQKGIKPLKKAGTVVCPRCSCVCNPGAKVCPGCLAKLPLKISEVLPDEVVLPSKIAAIVKLAPDVISGLTDGKKLLAEVKKYRAVISQIRREFTSKAKRLAASSRSEIRDGATTFSDELLLLENAVDALADDLENGRDISNSIAGLQFAGSALDELRSIIRETKRVVK